MSSQNGISFTVVIMLCILNLTVMLDHVIRVSVCPYFEPPNVIYLALAQIVVKSTSLSFFSALKGVKIGRQSLLDRVEVLSTGRGAKKICFCNPATHPMK